MIDDVVYRKQHTSMVCKGDWHERAEYGSPCTPGWSPGCAVARRRSAGCCEAFPRGCALDGERLLH